MICCIESWLKSVRVNDVELFKHDNAGSSLFIFFVSKLTIVKAKKFVLLGKKVRQNFDKVIVFVLVYLSLAANASIHEDITFTTVAMHVTE